MCSLFFHEVTFDQIDFYFAKAEQAMSRAAQSSEARLKDRPSAHLASVERRLMGDVIVPLDERLTGALRDLAKARPPICWAPFEQIGMSSKPYH